MRSALLMLVLAGLGLITTASAEAVGCAALAGSSLPAAVIGLPSGGALIDDTHRDQSIADAPVCVVRGRVRPYDPRSPDIRFQLNLPERWNGKAVHVGGGGFNGVLVDGRQIWFLPPEAGVTTGKGPLGGVDVTAWGYATFGSDSGHQWDGRGDPLAFALDEEALRNYGGDQLKKVRDVAVQLMRSFYGRVPRRTYFYGGSKGGQEALAVAQRWPDDYEGIVVYFPGYNFAAQFYATFDLLAAPTIDDAALECVAATIIETCDPLDNAADGIVSDVSACRAAFRSEALLCRNATCGACLSSEQLDALVDLTRPRQLASTLGGGGWAGWPFIDGVPGKLLAQSLGSGRAATRTMTDRAVRNMILKRSRADLARFDRRAHSAAFRRLAAVLDADSTDLDRFRARGGKLILVQGTVDTVVPPGNTIAYWKRLHARYRGGLKRFARFYMVPGFGHGSGSFVPTWDALAALDRWAGEGLPPAAVIAKDLAPGNIRRSRPLCEYPAWPRYRGAGSFDEAASFACVSR